MATVKDLKIARDITRVRYIGKDFDLYVTELSNFMKERFGLKVFNNFVASELGVMLIEVFAYGLSHLAWYEDRQATETYLETALLRGSISRLTRQIGYKMFGAIAASVDLDLSLSSAMAVAVLVQKGTQFVGSGGLVFETVDDVKFAPGDVGPVVVGAYEGETVTEVFTSDGSVNQVFRLRNVSSGKRIAHGRVTVIVAGEPWAESPFIDFEQTNHYELEYNADPPLVRFGDGIAGNIPAVAAEVSVRYISTSGQLGNVVGVGEITSIRSPLTAGFLPVPLRVTNQEQPTGGEDSELLRRAKVLAPFVFKAQGRAVTIEDYDALIQSFKDPLAGAIAMGKAFIIRDIDSDFTIRGIIQNLNNTCGELAAERVIHSPIEDGNVTYTAVRRGVIGNLIKIGHFNAGPSMPLSISVVPIATADPCGIITTFNVITITLATDSGGGIISTAAEVAAAINAHIVANTLVVATAEGTGAGAVGAKMPPVALTGGGPNLAISPVITLLHDYLDEVVSGPCRANIVQVFALARNPVGNYIQPSSFLIRALRDFLVARKEATVSIVVLDGSTQLVPCSIEAKIRVREGFDRFTVLSNSRGVLEGHLRDRFFSAPVRLSDLYELVEQVEGVQYSHIHITSPLAKVSPEGDLLIDEKEVITPGEVTVELIV